MDSNFTGYFLPTVKDRLAGFEENSHEYYKSLETNAYLRKINKEAKKINNKFLGSNCFNKRCIGKHVSNGYTRDIKILMLSGICVVKLKRFKCRACGKTNCPSKKIIPKFKISIPVIEKIVSLINNLSYKQASFQMLIQHGIKISANKLHKVIKEFSYTIKNMAQYESNRLFEHGIQITEKVDLKGEETLYVGIDGGFLSKWKQKGSFESKCCIFATGSKKINNRLELNNKYVYSSDTLSMDDFAREVAAISIKRGFETAKQVIVVSDGAIWIKNIVRDWFPNATHLLDIFHLKNKIIRLVTKKDEKQQHILEDALAKVDTYDVDLILKAIEPYKPYNSYKTKEKEETIQYIKNNKVEITNHKDTSKHGSGMVEKTVDLLIARRLKMRGMSWTKKGAGNIMIFKLLQLNGELKVIFDIMKGIVKNPIIKLYSKYKT
jgi:hypothetical protein